MNHETTHYDRDRLQRLLDDSLPGNQAEEVAQHVAECPECRGTLESLAGAAEWWTEACSGIKSILNDPAAYQSSGEVAIVAALSQSDESFASDFAVDFLAPSDDPKMLGRLDDYEILEVIGRGGMGIVFKGFQKELQRCVAVKVLAPHLALSAAARRRFEREAQATAAVVHPHVMSIHSVAANARLPYLVMPFVACESLQQRLDRLGPLDVKDVLRIGLQAANGLAAAHAQGLVHRDIKPANILLETNVDRVMLTDFGLARAVDDATLTRTGIIAGTPQYMSPEQANGDGIDHRSDLFSLGSVLYAMCAARPPFRAETTFGVLRRIREESPRPIREINSDVPEWLERIVMKLLAKSPNDRLASATDTADLFERCLAHVQQPTVVPLPVEIAKWDIEDVPGCALASTPTKKSWFSLRSAAVGVAISALIACVGFWIFSRPKPPTEQFGAVATQPDAAPETVPSGEQLLIGPMSWDGLRNGLESTAQMLEQLEANVWQDIELLNSDSANASSTTTNKEEQ